MKYGRRYYDKTCRTCGEEKRIVLVLHGYCLRCGLRHMVRRPLFYVIILLIIAVSAYLLAMRFFPSSHPLATS